MIDYFSEVDGVIVDRPMTAVFETIAAKTPLLCLCPDYAAQGLHDIFIEKLSNSLRIFSSVAEAIDATSRFLHSNLDDYIQNDDFIGVD